MRHDIGILWPDGTNEQRRLNLVVYGDQDGYSAMAKTVGLPTGIATRMILEGQFVEFNFQISNKVYTLLSLSKWHPQNKYISNIALFLECAAILDVSS